MRKVDESMLLHIVTVDFAMAASKNGICITQKSGVYLSWLIWKKTTVINGLMLFVKIWTKNIDFLKFKLRFVTYTVK